MFNLMKLPSILILIDQTSLSEFFIMLHPPIHFTHCCLMSDAELGSRLAIILVQDVLDNPWRKVLKVNNPKLNVMLRALHSFHASVSPFHQAADNFVFYRDIDAA